MFAKAGIARAWSRWVGVYAVALMWIASALHLTPLMSGIFVSVGTLAPTVVVTPRAEWRPWLWGLALIGLGMFEWFWGAQFGPVRL
jgi:hypothetical protein